MMQEIDDDVVDLDALIKRQQDEVLNPSPANEEPCPLSLYIYLFRKNYLALYLRSFEGLRALRYWLGPAISNASRKDRLSPLLSNYEIQRISEITGADQKSIWEEIIRQTEEQERGIELETPT